MPGASTGNGAKERRDPNQPSAVVGLGASAGGVAALQQFFGDMDPKSGLAFVVVMHLSPEHESQLASVIQQKTPMPVTQVDGPVHVRPDHIYVIPPNHQLTFDDSTLRLVPPQQAIGRRVTIDLFFRTLAQAYGQRAVSVILSGTDSDGVIGLKHIRAQGGLTIAQDPNEAEFDSMPASAISTGMIDWVLPVAEMPSKLLEFARNENRMKLPPEIPEAEEPDAKVEDAPGGPTVSDETRDVEDEEAIGKVLADLRAQTGHDFSHYKRATVLRRIARRLQVNSIESIPRYLEFLRSHSAEAPALLQDLLIGVTHFFRDGEAFGALEAHIPQLFAGKRAEDEVRVWVTGCATGEEAYSIAMLLCEHCNRLENPPKVQVFATDIDEQSIADARDGRYPAAIEADVSPERLRSFFAREQGYYRVRREIREKVLFAVHNLLKDAPFTRCDLIACRNLLIYLNPNAQETVFDIFHFALRAGGLLFLGSAENHGQAQQVFSALDPKHRIYVRRSMPRPIWKLPNVPTRLPIKTRGIMPQSRRPLPALTHDTAEHTVRTGGFAAHAGQTRRDALFGELHLRLLEEYGPPSVVVNELHDVVHLSGSAGRFLQFARGEPTANISKVVNPALAIELRTALFKASQEKLNVRSAPTAVEIDGRTQVVTLEVRPMRENDQAEGFFLILFETEQPIESPPSVTVTHDAVVRSSDEEIRFLKAQLANTIEQYEAANEEMKASNEELQAMNEEMRSTAEELETSKEELQSVNEELTTVNYELKSNVEELSRTNSDLSNLMASTDIGTIFLDRQLRVHRFTPTAQTIFNLIQSDMGRPIADITSKLNYAGFVTDALAVLHDLKTIEREVRLGDAKWFLTRIAPCRTGDDRIAGVVATFIDITRRKEAEDQLRAVSTRMERQLHKFNTVMSAVPDFIYHFDLEGRFTYVNQSFLNFWGKRYEDVVGKSFHDVGYPEEIAARLQAQIQQVIETGLPLKGDKSYVSAVGRRDHEYIFFPLLAADGSVEAVAGATRDITQRKQAEESLRASEERLRLATAAAGIFIWEVDLTTNEMKSSGNVAEVLGFSLGNNAGENFALIHPDDREAALERFRRIRSGDGTHKSEARFINPENGEVVWARAQGHVVHDAAGKPARLIGITQNTTQEKLAEGALQESRERFRLLVEGAKDYAMFLINPENIITFWSTGAERLFHWTQEEALGQSGDMIFTEEDRARGAAENEISIALSEGRAPDRRYHVRKDGSRFWADGVLMRLDDETGRIRGFAKVARDATDQKSNEEALLHARDEMEQRVLERTRDLLATNAELERTMAQRQQLERELLEISEREKRRIGEDLHDMICQELTATALFLQSTAKKMAKENPAAAKTLEESAQTVNRNVVIARELAGGLQAIELSASGLKNALRELAAQACQNTGIKCHFKCARGVRVPDDTAALHLYRVAQEAVTNAVKHSGAKNVLIHLDRNAEHICVSVQDDGKGFTVRKRGKGLGLHMMRYRANALGGKLKIERRKTGGMDVTCVIPLKR
ncbi:MAG: two-component system, chemotaxis family, CheB/CheR fusion protein [Verrucomicrobiota bacterium]